MIQEGELQVLPIDDSRVFLDQMVAYGYCTKPDRFLKAYEYDPKIHTPDEWLSSPNSLMKVVDSMPPDSEKDMVNRLMQMVASKGDETPTHKDVSLALKGTSWALALDIVGIALFSVHRMALDQFTFFADRTGQMRMGMTDGPLFNIPIEAPLTPVSMDALKEGDGDFLLSMFKDGNSSQRFVELAKVTTSSNPEGYTPSRFNDLKDAWGIYLAELNKCGWFITCDYKLKAKIENAVSSGRLQLSTKIVTPMQFIVDYHDALFERCFDLDVNAAVFEQLNAVLKSARDFKRDLLNGIRRKTVVVVVREHEFFDEQKGKLDSLIRKIVLRNAHTTIVISGFILSGPVPLHTIWDGFLSRLLRQIGSINIDFGDLQRRVDIWCEHDDANALSDNCWKVIRYYNAWFRFGIKID